MLIRRPLSPGGGWIEVSLYREYADLALGHLNAGRYFDAIVISCVGYDVLVNTLSDRIRLHHHEKLTSEQQKVIKKIKGMKIITAGTVISQLKKANVLHRRLDCALDKFNQERNKVIHPIERQEKADSNGNIFSQLSLKPGAIVPHRIKKEDAERFFRCYCHIIDLSGGESPRKREKLKVRNSFSSILNRMRDSRKPKNINKKTQVT
jgi:hypothetical protein